MAKSYGRQPRTAAGGRLSIKHHKLQLKIDKLKAQEHRQQQRQGIDVGYNKAHADHHEQDVKDRQKFLKKAVKAQSKLNKKAAKAKKKAAKK